MTEPNVTAKAEDLIDVWVIEPPFDSEFDELWTDDDSEVLKAIGLVAEWLFDRETEFTISVKQRSMTRSAYQDTLAENL